MYGDLFSYALYTLTVWGLDMGILSLCFSFSINIPEVEIVKRKMEDFNSIWSSARNAHILKGYISCSNYHSQVVNTSASYLGDRSLGFESHPTNFQSLLANAVIELKIDHSHFHVVSCFTVILPLNAEKPMQL
jgi:hypothetical protein